MTERTRIIFKKTLQSEGGLQRGETAVVGSKVYDV